MRLRWTVEVWDEKTDKGVRRALWESHGHGEYIRYAGTGWTPKEALAKCALTIDEDMGMVRATLLDAEQIVRLAHDVVQGEP